MTDIMGAKNHLAVCEADGEDDMLWPLSPHAPWRWNPVDEIDVSVQRVFRLKYENPKSPKNL